MFICTRRIRTVFTTALIVVGLIPMAASASPAQPYKYTFASPIFGLAAAPDGSLLVADSGAGIVELRKGAGKLIAPLRGVTEVAPIGRSAVVAVTGGGEARTARKLYRVSGRKV